MFQQTKIYRNTPAQKGYDYLPAGDASLTRRAKALAKQRDEEILIVCKWVDGRSRTTGYQMPAATLADARAGKKPAANPLTDSAEQMQRSEAAAKGAKTRKLKQAGSDDPYAVLLLALRDALNYSEQAKSRVANGIRCRDYRKASRSKYGWYAYQQSRAARNNDYQKKAEALEQAAKATMKCGINAGWQRNGDADSPIRYILYFDLPNAQLSFHSQSDCGLPPYDGDWDGVCDQSHDRIEAAIEAYLAGLASS